MVTNVIPRGQIVLVCLLLPTPAPLSLWPPICVVTSLKMFTMISLSVCDVMRAVVVAGLRDYSVKSLEPQYVIVSTTMMIRHHVVDQFLRYCILRHQIRVEIGRRPVFVLCQTFGYIYMYIQLRFISIPIYLSNDVCV